MTKGIIRYTNISSSSLHYVDFDWPVTLKTGSKYWLTLQGIEGNGIRVYPHFYKPGQENSDYGGTAYRAKKTIDRGATWSDMEGQESDLIFAIIGTVAPVKTYSTIELYNEVKQYQAFSPTQEPVRGWNTFLNVKQVQLMNDLLLWLEGYSGREQLIHFTGMPIEIIQEVPEHLSRTLSASVGAGGPIGPYPTDGFPQFWAADATSRIKDMLKSQNTFINWMSFGSPGDNRGYFPPEQMQTEYLYGIPLTSGMGQLSFNDWTPSGKFSIQNMSHQVYSRAFGEILQRMKYYGQYYGTEKDEVKLLLIGMGDTGIFPQFLTPAVNVTYAEPGHDSNLTKWGDFSQFDVIVHWSTAITQNANDRIRKFVQNGGGYVEFLDIVSSWSETMLGVDYRTGSRSSGTISSVNYDHPIVKPYTSISYPVQGQTRVIDATTATVVAEMSNGTPFITTNQYGSGRGVIIAKPYERLSYAGNAPSLGGQRFGSPRDSFITILVNAIYYAAGKENMLPIMWHDSFSTEQPWSPYLQYSINGKPGKPVLLWLSNNGTTPSNFAIHLNSSFYSIDQSGWIAFNIVDWQVVAKGTGSDIRISTTVPAKSWKPIYITSYASNLDILYTNIRTQSKTEPTPTEPYHLVGPYNTESWLVVNSQNDVAWVNTDNTGLLTRYGSLASLNSSAVKTGFYYDSSNKVLYSKFRTSSPVEVTVSQTGTPPTQDLVTVNPNGGRIYVDGVPITAQTTYSWLSDSTHTLDPDSGYSPSVGRRLIFTQWSGGNTADPRQITVSGDASYTAQWSTQYQLTVTATPVGGGTTSPSIGTRWYNSGTPVTVTETPSTGYTFDHWILDGSNVGTAPSYTVTMNTKHTLTAVFASTLPQYTVTVQPNGGAVSWDGVNWSTSPISVNAASGATLTLHAQTPYSQTSDTRKIFSQWNGGNTNNPRTVTVTSSVTYTANWQQQYRLQLSANPSGRGTTSPSLGAHWYNSGSSITLTASPNSGYTFSQWSGSIISENNPQTITMYTSKTITANFAIIQLPPPDLQFFPVTIYPNGGILYVDDTKVTISKTYIWDEGSVHTIRAEPNYSIGNSTRLAFKQWSDGSVVEELTVTVSHSTSYTAQWKTQYRLEFSSNTTKSITHIEIYTNTIVVEDISDSLWFDKGETVHLSAMAKAGPYRFYMWLLDDESNPDNTISVVMDSPHKATALYTPKSTGKGPPPGKGHMK
jgi:hypothetical protein